MIHPKLSAAQLEVRACPCGAGGCFVIHDGSNRVAEAVSGAQLASTFAAAPQLLEVAVTLRQHLALFCTHDDAIAKAIFDAADAVIAKANSADPIGGS